MKHIAVVGSINADMVTRTERFANPGETLTAKSFRMFPGGKGANQAVAIARLGYPVEFLGCVGDDVFAPMLKASLADAGVGTSDVEEVHDSSGIACITTLTSGENQILLAPGANYAVTPSYIERHTSTLIAASMILTQLETPMETLECVALIAEKNRIPLMLDPAPALGVPVEVMQRVTWLTPNQSEANLLLSDWRTGSILQSESDLLEELKRSGPRNVLLKLGARGLLAATEDGHRITLPAFPVQATDTTAAGDALNGGLAAALVQGLGVRRALVVASAVAAISVTRQGAQPSMPTGREVDAFLAQHASE